MRSSNLSNQTRHETSPFIIVGCGGFSKELHSWLNDMDRACFIGFYDENEGKEHFLEKTVFKKTDLPTLKKLNIHYLLGMGDVKNRIEVQNRIFQEGLKPYRPMVSLNSVIGQSVFCGDGTVICPGVVITTDVKIGMHCLFNINATIGHDVVIGDNCNIGPGANISGNVVIGNNVYIGSNAVIREKIKIGKNSTIGCGAVITKDVEEGVTVVGNPARTLATVK